MKNHASFEYLSSYCWYQEVSQNATKDLRVVFTSDGKTAGTGAQCIAECLHPDPPPTTTTTTTSTPAPAALDSDDLVLDFSSGQAQVVKSTAEKVNPISDQGLAKDGIKGFDIFKGLIDKLGLEDQFQDQKGKLTIFTPGNNAFSELPFDVNTLDTNALTKLITKHFVLGVLDSKSLPDGPVISHCTVQGLISFQLFSYSSKL